MPSHDTLGLNPLRRCWAMVLRSPPLASAALMMLVPPARRIGISLSDEFQLHPEQSTSALVVPNPHAKYFFV